MGKEKGRPIDEVRERNRGENFLLAKIGCK
jgi:hypothetical protein